MIHLIEPACRISHAFEAWIQPLEYGRYSQWNGGLPLESLSCLPVRARRSINSANLINALADAMNEVPGRHDHSRANAVRGSILIARSAGTSIERPLSSKIATVIRT
jgi:hypothetical protein